MAEAAHVTGLQHQFEALDQQHDAGTLGMWVFLVTEVMFFSGFFATYTIYRALHPAAFAEGSRLNEIVIGATNTVVLICSSLTMVLAIHAQRVGSRVWTVVCLLGTMLLGATFLGLKFLEYYHHYEEHLIPGARFAHPVADPTGVQMFMCFYFGMTGLHALHMIVGICVVAVITRMAWRGSFTTEYYGPLEVTGLYWHFVDIVWIFLFPLLYLVDLHR